MRLLFNFVSFSFFLSFYLLYSNFHHPIQAIYDPTTVPNNKFGIHILSATADESSPAADLVNTNGDWGYVTILAESKDRDVGKWQAFFNDLRRRHLIPIVRLATQPDGNHWKRPYEGEEEAWAGFLNNLVWPTKNRYVVIYNEPNHATEWGNQVDPENYAHTLNSTIDVLKKESKDFFVLNAGFDASAPQKPPAYFDQAIFMRRMDEAVPGIFNKLDGWVSHSYPNPAFSGSPLDTGRGSIRTWPWELQILKKIGLSKNLPVFITETGWKHAEGLKDDPKLPKSETVGEYFKSAFSSAWNSSRIIAVTPFLLNYQEDPFDHFSFKKYTGEGQSIKILGAAYPNYYPQFQTILNLPKPKGQPIQENKAILIKGAIFKTMVEGEKYLMELVFKNTGQSIWGEKPLILKALINELSLEITNPLKIVNVEPGGEVSFVISAISKKVGIFKTSLNLFHGENQFDSPIIEFETEVKKPVIISTKAALKWKKAPVDNYQLKIEGVVNKILDSPHQTFEVRYLLPEYTYDITIIRPFYKLKTIRKTLSSGENLVDFGTLEPDWIKAILHPIEFWKLLPFSG